MITQELIAYIRAERSRGTPIETIRKNLASQGWAEIDLAEAERLMTPVTPPPTAETEVASVPAFTRMPTREEVAASATAQVSVRPIATHKKRKWGLFITLLVLILVLIGGAYAFAQGYIPLPGKSNTLFNSAEATSVTFDIAFTVDATELTDSVKKDLGIDESKAVFRMTGSSDSSTLGNPKLDANFTLDGGELAANFDTRVLNNMLYARVTKAPDLGFFTLDPFMNKWYSFDYKKGSSLVPIPTEQQLFDSYTPAQKAELKRITKEAHIVKAKRDLLPKNIDGIFVWHYSFDLDKEGTKKYLTDISTYLAQENPEIATRINEGAASAIDNIAELKGEAWIGISDGLPYKISLDVSVLPLDTPEVLKITVLGTFSNWNKPVVIEAPENSVPFEDIVNELTKSEDATAEATHDQTQVQGTLSSMRAAAEIYYSEKGNYQGYCESKLHTDLIKNLQSAVPGVVLPTCKATKTEWIASAPLPTTHEFFCVDSRGDARTQATAPSGYTCSQ